VLPVRGKEVGFVRAFVTIALHPNADDSRVIFGGSNRQWFEVRL
jgi:hypothetical protein